MPIQLTTPFNPGDFDTVQYSKLKIMTFTVMLRESWMELIVEYGNIVDNVWVPGKKTVPAILITGSDYTALIQDTPNEGETVYEAVQRCLYQYILDKGIASGTIV
jgi:hypothetical protein